MGGLGEGVVVVFATAAAAAAVAVAVAVAVAGTELAGGGAENGKGGEEDWGVDGGWVLVRVNWGE